MSPKRILLYAVGLFCVLGIFIGFKVYTSIWSPNINKDSGLEFIEISSESSFSDVYQILRGNNLLKDSISFRRVAKLMNYNRARVPSGRFQIDPEWSNRELISALRSGIQVPVVLTFNNVRTTAELFGKISNQVEADSLSLSAIIKDPSFLEKHNYTNETILCAFIPNSYEVYWDVPAKKLIDKLLDEHKKFWNSNNRREKLESIGLTEIEAYTLASIVQKETNIANEKPTIAGVYLNRLKRNIALQADPTVVFAVGQFDLKRVLNKHLAFDSPYNTYLYPGLPPGPICMPDINSIDAVLNPGEHRFLYFCAKPGFDGSHAFAETLRQHNQNANRYRNWLNQQGIR